MIQAKLIDTAAKNALPIGLALAAVALALYYIGRRTIAAARAPSCVGQAAESLNRSSYFSATRPFKRPSVISARNRI